MHLCYWRYRAVGRIAADCRHNKQQAYTNIGTSSVHGVDQMCLCFGGITLCFGPTRLRGTFIRSLGWLKGKGSMWPVYDRCILL